MNFTDAPANDWQTAHNMIAAAARQAGYDHSRADDIAAVACGKILTSTWKHGTPESVIHAAAIMRARGRRYGWIRFDTLGMQDCRRSKIEPQPPVDRGHTPSPADMAEKAERYGIPVYRVHEANGIGPGALAEPGHSPSVYGSAPATPSPTAGVRLSRLETDPNPERTLQATHPAANPPQWREMDAEYRQALAEYYAGR